MLLYMLFFFNDTATTEIYTLSLHDALPIYDDHLRQTTPRQLPLGVGDVRGGVVGAVLVAAQDHVGGVVARRDRKSTRLNSSHANISYAVFCLKKKNKCLPAHIHRTSHYSYL